MSDVSSHKHKEVLKLTVNHLYYLLHCIRSRWYALGERLELPHSDLEAIEKDYATYGCDRCLIELFALWIERCTDHQLSKMTEALKKMHEEDLAQKIFHYTGELGRIESKPSSNLFSKVYVPLKEYCYEDWHLGFQQFELDKLSHKPIKGFQLEIAKRLLYKEADFYEIGIAMNIPKEKMEGIDKLEPFTRLIKVMDLLVTTFTFSFTWRMLIDNLLDMEFNAAARDIETLAMEKFDKHSKVVTTKLHDKDYRRSDFTSSQMDTKNPDGQKQVREAPSILKEDPYKDERCQKNIEKVRKILGLDRNVSDEDVLDNLYEHIVNKNEMSQEELQILTKCVAEISSVAGSLSKKLAQYVTELKEDMEIVKKVRSQLVQQKRKLELKKSSLEEDSKKIKKKIQEKKEIEGRTNQDDGRTDLEKLEREYKVAHEHLQEVCNELEICTKELNRANSVYKSINEQLNECIKKLDMLMKQLNSCNTFITDVLEKAVKFSPTGWELRVVQFTDNLLRVIKSGSRDLDKFLQIIATEIPNEVKTIKGTIAESLKVIKNSYEMIDETQDTLDFAEHPFKAAN